MRVVTKAVLTTAVAGFLIAGCSGYQPAGEPGAPAQAVVQASHPGYRSMIGPDGARSVLPEGFLPHAERPRWMNPPPANAAKTAQHIAVAQFGGSSVLWFMLNDKKNKPPTVCEQASSTNGIAVDRSGNLWVPDGRANTTTEYAPGCGAAKLTIPDPTGEPADVGFDGKNRVYILNLNNKSGPADGGI